MPDNHFKRLSLGWFPQLRKASSKSTLSHPPPPANADVTMESPPLVFYGPPSTSTGALLSGQLKLDVTDDNLDLLDYGMTLVLETTRKKPFHVNCADCSFVSEKLSTWKFLKGPQSFNKGAHSFPFSYLLKGSLPASVDGPLCKIQYVLHVLITTKNGEKITLNKILHVKRALQASDHPRISSRVFPPTKLTAEVQLPPLIYPIGEAMANFKVNGIVNHQPEGSLCRTQIQWKLQKMLWHITETNKSTSPACDKHAAKLVAKPGEQPKLEHKRADIRIIGQGSMESGWKMDYSSGVVEMEFPFSIKPNSNPVCDLKVENGTEVTHQLVIELVASEESAPISNPERGGVPTGQARRLRMQFNVVVTERLGLGISWDEEQPPVYEDVPASPPHYRMAEISDYNGSPFPSAELGPVPDYEPLPQ